MDTFLLIFLTTILVLAAVNDLRFQKIPNLLTFTTMALGLGYHSAMGGLDGLFFSAGGLVLGMAILILPYLLGGMGAGDAKLMGAVGAILGSRGVFIAFLFTAIVGGVYALIILLINTEYSKALIKRSRTMLKTLIVTGQFIPIPAGENENKPKLCYGIAIAGGTLLSVFLELLGQNFVI